MLVGTVPAFAITQIVVNRYRAERQRLALEWSARGQRDLASRPADAVTDFVTAMSYGSDRPTDRLLLARALVASERPAEAKAQLLGLAAEDMANGDVNLELARIAAAGGDVDEAVRYYHAAADGVWAVDAPAARREARIELARFLMSHGQQAKGQAELIGALQLDARETLDIAERVLTLDPYVERLGPRARGQRVRRALAIARARFDRCHDAWAADETVASRLDELRTRLEALEKQRPETFERSVAAVDEGLAVAFDIEKLPPGACGADSSDDRAVAAIASQHATPPR